MPLIATRGAASVQGFGAFAQSAIPNYIEDVFSTYLYTGNGATQTINNGIDLAGKGGLTWIKSRSGTYGAYNNTLTDSTRGVSKILYSDNTNPQTSLTGSNACLTAFNTTGFSLGADAGSLSVNQSSTNYASWTFREQPKFFDVVTWTGNSTARTIAHNLGSVPGCILVKCTSMATDWNVYHQSIGNNFRLLLNATAEAYDIGNACWNATTPTASVFSLGTNSGVNASGETYVAYLFAHNAGGFGLTGTDNVVSCGGFTADGAGAAIVSLGYEPQWLLVKRTSSATDWQLYDNMRGFTVDNVGQLALRPNTSTAESAAYPYAVNATGFSLTGVGAGNTFIYIAIRRGPMKVPTDGTKVFKPVAYSGNDVDNNQTTNFPVDLGFVTTRNSAQGFFAVDRLRGPNKWPLDTWQTAAESTLTGYIGLDSNTQFKIINNGINRLNSSAFTYVIEAFQRAPGFFDEVCYTGTNGAMTIGHNLTVVPELIINKSRTIAGSWFVYAPSASATFGFLNTTDAFSSLGSQVATATTYDPVSYSSTSTYVSYLFATCPGVSKVGSYTGTGTLTTINCGFAAGARFVLIKRTDAVGAWYVWDSARGLVSGTDPSLQFNDPSGESNANSVYAVTTGFQLLASPAVAINTNAASYIFLAIA